MRTKPMTAIIVSVLFILFVVPVSAKIPIRMVTYGDAFDAYRNVERAFNETHPDYELTIEPYPYGEYISKVTVMMAAGTAPDVLLTWAQHKPAWVEGGMLLDLAPFWDKSETAQTASLYPFIMDAAAEKDGIYGVPQGYTVQTMIVNVDAFNHAGLSVPVDDWTTNDMAQYALKLHDPDNNMYGVQLAGHWSINNWQWAVLYNGTGWLSEDKIKVLVDEPEHLEMLEFWYDLAHNRGVANAPGAPVVLDQWQGGFGMWLGWLSYAFTLADNSPYDWALATMPKGPAGQDAFGQGHIWSIPSNAPDPDKSWVLLEWLLSFEGQQAQVQYENRQPISADSDLWSLYFSRLPDDKRHEVQNFVMQTLFGQNLVHNMTYWPTWTPVENVMNRHLNTIFAQHVPPANAMARAGEEIRAILAGN